jgi:glutamine phosphoribosylpyrophosphate amidotransferase
MCGIVAYYGRSHGINKVLNALELLAYRAPDSSGLAVIDAAGKFAIRRAVGTAKQLREKLGADPLPPLRENGPQIVAGHGRWAMVGAVTENNTHPISDRSQTRIVCENGSHNASLMLRTMAEQEIWWQERGAEQPIHRTQNSTEVLACEWERIFIQLDEEMLLPHDQSFLRQMDKWEIEDKEERALRLAAWRLREGNAHA